MNEKRKVFFIDLDGTTLDIKKGIKRWISDENLKAIKKTRDKNNEVIISTGRLGISAQDYIDLFGGEYSILGNGSQIINRKNKKLIDLYLSIQQVLKILEIAQKHQMSFKHSGNYIVYGVKKFFWRYIVKKLGFTHENSYNFEMHKKRHKIVLWGKISKKKIRKIKDEINKNIKGVIAVTSSKGYSIEITHINATKGKAAQYVSKLLNVKKQNTFHIGDTMNDSTTLKFVGKLIAMKNSEKELLKISNYIGPNYKNNGLAKILNGEYKKIKN